MTIDQPGRQLALRSVLPVWVLVIIGAVLVGILVPAADFGTWLPIVLALAVILSFCIQLGTEQKEGFVDRVTASLVGSVVILGLASLVLGLIALAGG